jgi:DNA-binding CsgD family transcriptional regulator
VTADRDRYRTLTAAAVLLVAAIAAVVSFIHIESMASRYGQPILAAVLLPVSIDGTVAVSSLAMLRAARLAVSAPWLARGMLLLAVVATLACNVAYGLPHGWPGALLSGWPAVAFVGCAEVAIAMSGKRPARKTATATRVRKRPRPETARPSATDTEAAILAALASNPDATNDDLAAAAGVSARTARRYRSRLASTST